MAPTATHASRCANRPASSTVTVKQLMRPEVLIEIEAIAALD
jgi:enamine deaminase RidA (YjgF/YER057c/UK114 family)